MILKKITFLVAGTLILLSVSMPATGLALFDNSQQAACNAIATTDNNGSVTNNECASGASTVNKVLSVIINVFSAIVGIIAVIMIIVAGLKFITAGGDSSAVAAARSTLLYAIIGLAIAVLAQVIAHFVISKGTPPTTTGYSGSTSASVAAVPVVPSYIIT